MPQLLTIIALVWLYTQFGIGIFILLAVLIAGFVLFGIYSSINDSNEKKQLDERAIDVLIAELRSSANEQGVVKNFIDEQVQELRNSQLDDNPSAFPTALQMVIDHMVMNQFICEHYDALTKDYSRRIRTDAYGVEQAEQWYRLLGDLLKNKIYDDLLSKYLKYQEMLPHHEFYFEENSQQIASEELDILISSFDALFRIEYEYREGGKDKHYDLDDIDDVDDGFDYEYAISGLINSNLDDWNAEVTQGSGDQGVDVIAEHESGTRVAIQCKRYSKPVGNKAVQEVAAGQTFYGMEHAFVVTNNSFTKSALELAERTGIELLHHSELLKELEKVGDDSITLSSYS